MRYTWRELKAERTAYFWRFRYGWKWRRCTACNGSGRYDHNGSPECGACDGTGRESYEGPKALGNRWRGGT